MMSFFLGKNSRDPDVWDLYVKYNNRQSVWASLHVDCLGDSMPGVGVWPHDSDIECVIVPKKEYDTYRDALTNIMRELGVPDGNYLAHVVSAYEIARETLGMEE